MAAPNERFLWMRNRAMRLAMVVGAAVLVAVIVWVFLSRLRPTSSPVSAGVVHQKLVPRLIDGIPDTVEHQNLTPVAVVVQNITTARPQEGLEQASLVFETWAEGGITRFLAVFVLAEDLDRLGPIRSARPYFVDWAKEFGGLFVHAGGSPQAFTRIRETGVNDWDELSQAASFFRFAERSKTREHTLFTDTRRMRQAIRSAGLSDLGSFEPWRFEADAPLGERGEAQTVTINWSTPSYLVRYVYDRATNSYRRFHGEAPHLMANGRQIAPKNVAIARVRTSLFDELRVNIETSGGGEAVVLRNGHATPGTWKKNSPDERLRFYDAAGQELSLTAGQTWIEAVPLQLNVTY